MSLPLGLLSVAAAAIVTFALVRPYEAQLNSFDASLYLGAAAHLADGGAFVNADPVVAEMTLQERREFFAGALFRTDRAGAYYHRFPGGVQLLDPEASSVTFNFYHLWPAWLALGLKAMGSAGFLAVLSLFVATSALSLFMLGRLLGGSAFGIACVATLFAMYPQLHYSRMPLSELPAQAFFLAGLWCFLRAIHDTDEGRARYRYLAGLLWGCLCLSRADGALLLFPALCLAFLASRRLRQSWLQWLPMALPLIALAGLAVLHQIAGNAYETPLANSASAGEFVRTFERAVRDHERAFVIVWSAAITVAGLLASRSPLLRKAVACGAAGAFFLATIVWLQAFPLTADWSRILHHLQWIALYLPVPILALLFIGVALLALLALGRPEHRTTALILLLFLGVPLTSFLINAMVSETQPWAIRRFVPMAFPLFITCALLGYRQVSSDMAAKWGRPLRHGYLVVAAVAIVFLAPKAAVLWREPLYRGVEEQLEAMAGRIPADALVVMPYSFAGMAVAVHYGQKRPAVLLPLDAARDSPMRPEIEAYLGRLLSAGRKVIALSPRPPSTSQLLTAAFDLRPAFSSTVSYFYVPEVAVLEFPGSLARAQIPFHAFEVLAHGAAPKIDPLAAQISREEIWRVLAAGIDFSKPSLPPAVASMAGWSHSEPAGRWTDGPVARLQFAHALPDRFSLEFDVRARYPRDRSSPLKVVVGDQARDLPVDSGARPVRLDFAPSAPADAIELRISEPRSPKSRGESNDARELGVQVKSLRMLIPGPETNASERKDPPPGTAADSAGRGGEIDLSKPGLPEFVSSVAGISTYEPRGRWTDGVTARVQMRQRLPLKFTLEIVVADVYGPTRGQPVTVRVGDAVKVFVLQAAPTTVQLAFDVERPQDTIVFEIPSAASPASRGESADRRQLGIRLEKLRIVAGDRRQPAQSK